MTRAEQDQAERDNKAQAAQNAEDIRKLQAFPSFTRYWQRRIEGVVAKARETVLEGEFKTPEELYRARMVYHALKREVHDVIASDLRSAKKQLGDVD